MNRVVFEIENGSAVCPFNGHVYAYTATLSLLAPERLVRIEDVVAWVTFQREAEASAEEMAVALAQWAHAGSSAVAAIAEVRHESIDGVTLTARSVVR